MNIQNWRTALIESEMTDKAKLVGLVLSVYWNNKGKIYPSLTTLENDCSLTKNTIIRAVTELTDNNFVTVTKEHHRKSSFKINTYSLTGVTIAPMNDTVNEPMIDRANEPSIDSVTTAPMNAPELDIKVFKGIKEKDTIVSKKKEVAPPNGVDEQVWNDWMKIRKAKRVPITETALHKFSDLAKDYGFTISQLIEICIERGWASATDNYLSNAGYEKKDAVYEEYWNEEMGRRETRRKA